MSKVMKEGARIPRVELPDRDNRSIPLFESGEDFTVIYFYPKDDTPGCTLEAQGFNRLLPGFLKEKARIVGISGGDARSKEKFCKKFDLEITLLSDSDYTVSRQFGAYGPKVFMGRKYEGILRKTFVFDKAGKLIKLYDTVKPEEHPEEVLAFISGLKGGKPAGKAAAPAKAPAKKAAGKRSASKGKAGAKSASRARGAKPGSKAKAKSARR